MNNNEASFQRLGELVLEEILVRSGIQQPHLSAGQDLTVSLDFRAQVDEASGSVIVAGNHYDGAPFTLRLEIAAGD